MFKKILTTSVLGVSALAAMTANAMMPGIYINGQFGYANTDMGNKLNSAKYASELRIPSDDPLANLSISNNGLAGRIALGYQFNQNFAVEAGYLHLGDQKVNITHLFVNDFPQAPRNVFIKLQQNVIDFVGKGILPITSKINLYGKLGLAYITTPIQGLLEIEAPTQGGPSPFNPLPVNINLNDAADIAQHKWAPEAAIGVSYDISPNVSVDASWTHIQPLGSHSPGNIDFMAVGLGYSFG